MVDCVVRKQGESGLGRQLCASEITKSTKWLKGTGIHPSRSRTAVETTTGDTRLERP
jgi:hypothetical protein